MLQRALLCAASSAGRIGQRGGARPIAMHAPFDYDVIVIGGGAAGLFSGITAARAAASVLVLESGSQPLRKVRISGGGRCNVMHDHGTWDPRGGRELLLQRYPRGAPQLTGSLTKRFSPPETAAWFEAEGVALKREEDGRVFPTTDDSGTVVDALLGAASRAGVELRLGSKVVAVERLGGGANDGFAVSVVERGKGSAATAVRCCSIILATGSASHNLASELGHEITPLIPSLFSFRLCGAGILDASLAGISVQDAQLTLVPSETVADGAKAGSQGKGKGGGKGGGRGVKGGVTTRGPVLVTHRGISGPAALKLSAFGARELAACRYRGTLHLNLVPEMSRSEVSEAMGSFRVRMPAKAVANANPFGLPKRLWAAVVAGPSDAAGGATDSAGGSGGNAADAAHAVDPSRPWGQLSKADMRALEERTCRAALPFSGKDSNKDEFVTCGGVSWSAVDSTRMQSKHVDGVFFAGELLDVDGVTGGHNFQSCWTTGHVAGMAAAEHAGRGAPSS